MEKKKVVVVGGGTGTHTALRGLKNYSDQLELGVVVSMSDSGGSAGRLRDEFGFLPVGDIRNVLTALASEGDENYQLLRQLFSYRFSRGGGLSGHNFGNLFLTALTDILGDEVLAIEAAAKILRITGKVIPVTKDNVHLVAKYADGRVIFGEHYIDEPSIANLPRITELSLTPMASLTPQAYEALTTADMIVFGPGDLYTSILANCVVDGFKEAVAESHAKLVYVCNLMSKAGQTVGMTAKDHTQEIQKYINCHLNTVLVNTDDLPVDLIEKYQSEGDHPILNNLTADSPFKVVARPLMASEEVKLAGGDVLKRSLIRHDSDKLAAALVEILG